MLDHYLFYHNIDKNNWFFKKLFQTKNKVLLKNCVRCSEFLTTKKHKATHDFLEYYKEGKDIPFEEKPLDISKFPNLLIYSLNFRNIVIFITFTTLINVSMISLKMYSIDSNQIIKIGFSVLFILKTSRIL